MHDTPDIFMKAADAIAYACRNAINEKGFATIALCGGRSAPGVCKQLCHEKLPWDRIHIFVIDERLVPITHPESNFKLIKDHLIDKVPIPHSNVHPFIYNTTVSDEGTQAYAQEFLSVGSRFDAILLSVGENAHVAGLHPHHKALHEKKKPFIAFHDSPKPPIDRMTATPHVISSAGLVVMLFMGAAKRDAWLLFKKNAPIEDCPAAIALQAKKSVILHDLID